VINMYEVDKKMTEVFNILDYEKDTEYYYKVFPKEKKLRINMVLNNEKPITIEKLNEIRNITKNIANKHWKKGGYYYFDILELYFTTEIIDIETKEVKTWLNLDLSSQDEAE